MSTKQLTRGIAYYTTSGGWRIERYTTEQAAISTLRQFRGFAFDPTAPDLYEIRVRLFRMMRANGVEPA